MPSSLLLSTALYLCSILSIVNSLSTIRSSFSRATIGQSTFLHRSQRLPITLINKRSNGLSFTQQQRHHTTKTTASQLSMIFERMSEECIGSLVTAQSESARLGQPFVGCEVMTIGIIDRPEKARKTLKTYTINLRKAKLTVEHMFRDEANANGCDNGEKDEKKGIFTMSPQLLNMNKKARDVELPFAPPLKRVLTQAGSIADSFNSPTVNSEHVLLSLLGYDALAGCVPNEIDAIVEERGYAKGALAVFLRMEGVDSSSFSASEFCNQLVVDINNANDDGPQLVTGNDSSSSTPTLSDVGVDLTELAERGELDPVYGRDYEVKNALRTLVRRRKNNPCLMGEPGKFMTLVRIVGIGSFVMLCSHLIVFFPNPLSFLHNIGVGKTAIAEGVAQILASPNMLERLDEIYEINDEGNYIKQNEIDRIKELSKLCPSRLRNHRVISLELANLVAGTKYRGEFEERLQSIIEEVTDERAPPTILFIDGEYCMFVYYSFVFCAYDMSTHASLSQHTL